MKRFVRCPAGLFFLAPLVLGVACIAPAHNLGAPWPALGEATGTTPWPWGDEPTAQAAPARPDPAAGEVGDGRDPMDPAASDRAEPPLLSWDGGVVDGPPAGSVTEVGGSRRDLGKPGDRWHIIELYQVALKERDELAGEVATLSAALERAYGLLDDSEKNGLALTNQVGTAQGEVDRLRGENDELAARLATAQIRRLEAEKMLLEAQIEAHRRREAAGTDVAMGAGQ